MCNRRSSPPRVRPLSHFLRLTGMEDVWYDYDIKSGM